jgi:hypothetical protein
MEKKKVNLFLDDVRVPMKCSYMKNPVYFDLDWEIVRSYNEFVEFIKTNGIPDLISFDHDLAEAHYSEKMYSGTKVYMQYLETVSEKSGSDCVKWLVEFCMDTNQKFPEYLLHTMNPAGKENMESYIQSYLKSLQ